MNQEPNIPETPETPPAGGKPPKAPGTGWFSRMGTRLSLWTTAVVNHASFRIITIAVATAIALLLVFYCAAEMFIQEGAFTIKTVKSKPGEECAISLTEKLDYGEDDLTTGLKAMGVESMTNISGLDIPDSVVLTEGCANGEHYLAYSFYVVNTGDVDCDLTAELKITNAVKGVTDAIRVRMYKNGSATTYANMGVDKDGNPRPEDGTTPFEGKDTVFTLIHKNFEVDEIIKYTFVIWLEGDDPECLDNIKGGRVNFSLEFTAKESS